MESDICRVDGNNYEQSENRFDLDHSGSIRPERIADVEAVSVENGSNNAVGLSCVGGAAGTVIRKRKILIKTVRIVKKVIKKRVPKRVLIGGKGIRGEAVKVEDVTGEEVDDVSAQMESEMLKPVGDANVSEQIVQRNDQSGLYSTDGDDIKGNDAVFGVEGNNGDLEVGKAKFILNERENAMTENQLKNDCLMENQRIDIVDKDIVPKGEESGVLGEEENGKPIVKDESCSYVKFIEGLLLSTDGNGIKGNEAGETKFTLGTINENRRIDIVDKQGMELLTGESVGRIGEESGVLGEEENGRPNIKDGSCSYEVESDRVKFTEGLLHSTDGDGIKGNDDVFEVERNNGDLEVREAKFTLGTINERETTMTDNQLKDCLVENRRIDIVDKAGMEPLPGESVGRIGEESGVLGEKENGKPIVKDESCSYEFESDRVKFPEGLLLSEEMEAVERKKKRKTEIFLGGLSKGTKEEDIRAVFEGVGLVVDVRLVVNPKTGKNRGFAFVRFATAADATNALLKYSRVEICGKLCNAAPVEGNDTIFLGNIDRNWKTEDFVKLLEKAGIEKIDKVTLKADPNNTERNRGFAFVELQTSKDAQTAFNTLQKKDAFGKNQKVKVAWASLNEPAEEEILQVKSVYAEYLPSSWDEEKVKEYFKRFGEIESVVLAKNLSSTMRRDFAVINYTTRDAALTCIEAVNRERLGDDCSKVKMAASLAKPNPKKKQVRHTFNPTSRQHLEAKKNVLQTSKKLYLPRNNGKASSSSYDHVKAVSRPHTTSTTEELVQLLRQQASTNHNPPYPGSGTGAIMPDHHFLLPGSKRPFSQMGHEPLYVERQQLSRVRMESSYQFSGPRSLSHGVDLLLPPYHHQPGPGFPSESINGRRNYPSPFQIRDRASYYEDTNPYHRH